jgi:hypothetical protein
MIDPWARYDMIDHRDPADSAEHSEPVEPIEKADKKEPTDPTDSADPIEPIDRNEPLEPIDSTESSDHSDHRDPPMVVEDRTSGAKIQPARGSDGSGDGGKDQTDSVVARSAFSPRCDVSGPQRPR